MIENGMQTQTSLKLTKPFRDAQLQKWLNEKKHVQDVYNLLSVKGGSSYARYIFTQYRAMYNKMYITQPLAPTH